MVLIQMRNKDSGLNVLYVITSSEYEDHMAIFKLLLTIFVSQPKLIPIKEFELVNKKN